MMTHHTPLAKPITPSGKCTWEEDGLKQQSDLIKDMQKYITRDKIKKGSSHNEGNIKV